MKNKKEEEDVDKDVQMRAVFKKPTKIEH